MVRIFRGTLMTSTVVMVGLIGSAAGAQTAAAPTDSKQAATAAPEGGEIVVTAQRRAENIQKIPLAIQAVAGPTLTNAGVTQFSQLSTVTPSFVYSGSGPEPTISLRGIGGELVQIAGEPSVSLSLDGVPLLRQQYFLGAFFDVERVEVLRGPQGTISGRNSTGGAINIISRQPSFDMQGGADVTYGNFHTFNLGLWASGPIIDDKLAAHFAIERRKSDGYVQSTITGERFGGHDDISGRVSLLATPTERIKLTLSGNYYNSDDNSPAYVSLGLYDPQNVSAVIDPPGFGSTSYYDPKTRKAPIAGLPGQNEVFTQRTYGTNLQGAFELNDTTTLKTVTGYEHLSGNERYESVPSPTSIDPIYTPYQQHQFSQEASITSSIGDTIDLLFGGQYLNENAKEQTSVIYLAGLAGPAFSGPAAVNLTAYDQIKLRSLAAFGQVEWRFAPTFQLTLGGRYTSDRKTYHGQLGVPAESPPIPAPFGPDIRQHATFNKFTPRVALDWKPNDDVTAYASWSKGFKAGGFGTAGALSAPGTFGPFKPENATNYEVGIKTTWLDRHLTFNLTGFWADYKDLQYPFFVAPATIIANAGKARVRGIEAEFGVHPIQGLDLTLNATYLDAKYREFSAADPGKPTTTVLGTAIPGALGVQDLAGNSLSKAPKLSIASSASYRFEIGGDSALTLRADVRYQSKIYFSAFNVPDMSQSRYALLNVRATYDIGKTGLSIAGWARNLTNKNYFQSKTQNGSNLAGLDPRLPGTIVGGVPSNLVAVSTLEGNVGEPRTYGVTASYKF